MRAVVYVRQSLDRKQGTEDEGLAVARQTEDCRRLCADRGWAVIEVVTENNASATRGQRPQFARVLDMVDDGAVDVVVVWHVDRLVRRLAELEDVITRCERSGVRLATVSGDIDLSTDAGRLVGRILASVARGEVERKSARQRRALRQAAEAGKPVRWAHRAFGYNDDGLTARPVEARAVREACAQLLSGGTLRSIAAQWRAAGLAPPQRPDAQWRPTTVRQVVLNPRIGGLSTYRGEIVGTGRWEPLVPEETWRAVHALLTDPARNTPKRARSLLGGLARCWCGSLCYGGNNSRGRPIYRCHALPGGGGGHIARMSAPIDEFVTALVLARLSRPDAADLLVDDTRPDLDELRGRARVLRARLDEIAGEFAGGAIPAAMVRTMTDLVTANLSAVEAEMAEAGRVSVLGPLITGGHVAAAWSGLDNDRRRAVISALFAVTLHPPGRGARTFDPSTVAITWRAEGA